MRKVLFTCLAAVTSLVVLANKPLPMADPSLNGRSATTGAVSKATFDVRSPRPASVPNTEPKVETQVADEHLPLPVTVDPGPEMPITNAGGDNDSGGPLLTVPSAFFLEPGAYLVSSWRDITPIRSDAGFNTATSRHVYAASPTSPEVLNVDLQFRQGLRLLETAAMAPVSIYDRNYEPMPVAERISYSSFARQTNSFASAAALAPLTVFRAEIEPTLSDPPPLFSTAAKNPVLLDDPSSRSARFAMRDYDLLRAGAEEGVVAPFSRPNYQTIETLAMAPITAFERIEFEVIPEPPALASNTDETVELSAHRDQVNAEIKKLFLAPIGFFADIERSPLIGVPNASNAGVTVVDSSNVPDSPVPTIERVRDYPQLEDAETVVRPVFLRSLGRVVNTLVLAPLAIVDREDTSTLPQPPPLAISPSKKDVRKLEADSKAATNTLIWSPPKYTLTPILDDYSRLPFVRPIDRFVGAPSLASLATAGSDELTSIPNPPALRDPAAPVGGSAIKTNTVSETSFDIKAAVRVILPVAEPALINGQTTFSTSMLKPLSTANLDRSTVIPETAIGPITRVPNSSEKDRSQPDQRVVTVAANRMSAPVLINGVTNFSSELLRPMDPAFPTFNTDGGYCDANFIGPPIRFSQTVELRLDDLLNQLHARFGINFIIGPGIAALPLNIKAGSVPWNRLLHSQLYISGVQATCVEQNTIELVLNSTVKNLERERSDAERLETRYIKLKYLQPTSAGNRDVAGRNSLGQGLGQGVCQQSSQLGGQGSFGSSGAGQNSLPQTCKFERLMVEIGQILGLNVGSGAFAASGQTQTPVTSRSTELGEPQRPYVGQVPGRNMLIVRGTQGQLDDIGELISHADIPPFQVVIKGLVYTANENKLRDIGVQSSLIVGSGNLNTLGGVTSQPSVSTTGTDTGTGTTTTSTGSGQLNPGGVRTLGPGFPQPAGTGDGVFGFSTIVGTAQFSVLATALEQNGVISVKSRPFATVLDGDSTDLTVGRQVPVIVQAVNSLGGPPGTLQILQAANLLSVTPHVIDNDQGEPVAVTLELQLDSNDVDTSVISQGVPSVSVRSIQSKFILNQDQTVILGGFTVDSDSKSVSKVPGLGDIPLIGELFKRRVRTTQINRLFFAISVSIVPYGSVIEPVVVPGATTDIPSTTENMRKRADSIEPKASPSKNTGP